jgi:thiamine-phosphate pyrophosphorylase
MSFPALYPILDTASLHQRGMPLVAAADAMLAAGAGILQLRHKGHFSRAVFDQAGEIGELCRRFGATWIVDDRADMAKLLGAGVHVGQDDLPPRMARQIVGEGAIIGFSTHNEVQLRQARDEPIDYVALGPVFSTSSKSNPDPVLGVEEFGRCRQLTERPLVAIGGITRDNALSVLRAGATSVAVIGDLLPEPCTWESIHQRMREWLQLLRPDQA